MAIQIIANAMCILLLIFTLLAAGCSSNDDKPRYKCAGPYGTPAPCAQSTLEAWELKGELR